MEHLSSESEALKELGQHGNAAQRKEKASENEQSPAPDVFQQADHSRRQHAAQCQNGKRETQKPVATRFLADIQRVQTRGRKPCGYENLGPGLSEPAGKNRCDIKEQDAPGRISAPAQFAVKPIADRQYDRCRDRADHRHSDGERQTRFPIVFRQCVRIAFLRRERLRVPYRRIAQRTALRTLLQSDSAFDTIHTLSPVAFDFHRNA